MFICNRALVTVTGNGGLFPATVAVHEYKAGYALVIDAMKFFVASATASAVIAGMRSTGSSPVEVKWRAGFLHWVELSFSSPTSGGWLRVGIFQYGFGFAWTTRSIEASKLHHLASVWENHVAEKA